MGWSGKVKAGVVLACLVAGCAGGPRAGSAGPTGIHPGRLRMLTESSLDDFRARFDDASGTLRYIAVFSPT
ncbi:MAG: hypothetical protein ACREAA_07855 [Candidatus Polarisedimenticolia bacterium]